MFFLQTLGNYVSEQDIAEGALYPPLSKALDLSILIAKNIMDYAYANGKLFIKFFGR